MIDNSDMNKYDYFDGDGNKIKNVAAIECCIARNDNSITCTFTKRDGAFQEDSIEDIQIFLNENKFFMENMLYGSTGLRDAAFTKLHLQLFELDVLTSRDKGITTRRKGSTSDCKN